MPAQLRMDNVVQWGGVGFAMSGFWEYFYGHIPLLEFRVQVSCGRQYSAFIPATCFTSAHTK